MLLEVKGLYKNFGGLAAVDELDFHITEGELVSIIGPNGSGKTTLFNLITGVFPPRRGSIFFRGEEITNLKPHVIASKGIGRTFQMTTIFATETALDNLLIGLGPQAKSSVLDALVHNRRFVHVEREYLEQAMKILSFIGLEGCERQLVGNMTQEAQKRLSIGLALATNPKLILLDEPTGGVNLEEMGSILSLIGKVRDMGITVCLIEHKMQIVMSISDRIMVLNYGRKIAEGIPEEISKNKEVIEAYLGKGYVA